MITRSLFITKLNKNRKGGQLRTMLTEVKNPDVNLPQDNLTMSIRIRSFRLRPFEHIITGGLN